MTAITLRLIDPEKNKARFYHLDIQHDLFGDWCLIREWGRIGAGGKMLSRAYESAEKADKALMMHKNRKMRRGYR